MVMVRMNATGEKRIELFQTVSSLVESIREEKGCMRCDFYQSMEDESHLLLLEEWETQEDLTNHTNSAYFKVLRGVLGLLEKPYEIRMHKVSLPEEVECVKEAP